jgi:hypothetical protein
VYVDLPGFKNPEYLYTSIIPDITVLHNNKAYILELTCCYEKNLEASKLYKLQKYNNPSEACKASIPFAVHTVEVSSLGFIPIVNLNRFCRDIGIPPYQPVTIRRMGEMALRCSYFLFCFRHKPWPLSPSDPFVH